jgi:ribosome biogenesis GTPase
MAGLDGDFNPRRLERALLLTWEGGAEPVIVLNKTDLCVDFATRRAQLDGVAAGVAVVPLSAATGAGVEALDPWLQPGRTVVLLGSSGVGKSTLTNRLLGQARQATRAVRAGDDRGRHTTTHRELLPLPGGALLIDTPGLRELTLWADDQALGSAFGDIEALASQCAFGDCSHRREPRCAVQAALASGQLEPQRLASFFKLQAELRALAVRQDAGAQAAERQRWKSIHKAMRHFRPPR